MQDSVLLVLLVVITIGAYLLLKDVRSKRVMYFGNISTLQRTHNFRLFQPSKSILIFKLAMVVLLYLVATNTIEAREISPITDTDYMLVIDNSASMATTDITPNRLEGSKNLALQLLGSIPNTTQVGFIGFGQTIDTLVPTMFNRGPVRNAVNQLSVDYALSGTDLDNAINFAVEQFNDSIQKKTILLFTDGTEVVENDTLDKANQYGVRILVFGMGSNETRLNFTIDDEDIPEELLRDYQTLNFNFTILENIANRTNGEAYFVSTNEQLTTSFNRATNEEVAVPINTGYYIIILIALISILELVIYAYIGAI